jgi:protein-L-isoaspartate(D-aspartate) O-methyltransferase
VNDCPGDELAQMRERLATQVIAANKIGSERVAAALHAVPRHLFLPEYPPEVAYLDDAIVTKRDATGQPVSSSSQPAIMAIMLDQLDLAPGHRVLEIGAGTGYNAALISHIVAPSGQVTSVDIDSELVRAARAHLSSAGYSDVTVGCADGAEGYPEHAPYDRIIATVGVSDLAGAWLEQAMPDAQIVVPLDLRGIQVSVSFARADPAEVGGAWTSRSLAPCGFMRMRGSLAGPEGVVMLAPGLSIMLPNGTMPPGGQDLDPATLAALLATPPVLRPTGVQAGSVQVIWGLGLWLAAREPRSCRLNEELRSDPADQHRPAADQARLVRAPLRAAGWHATLGIVDSGGIAVLTADHPPGTRFPGPKEPAAEEGGKGSGLLTLGTAGFGPHAAELAADLAAQVRAWGEAGRTGIAGLHIDAYPRSAPGEPPSAPSALVMERPGTRFVVYHAR